MKYLIAGLGNFGDEYLNTRHNIGFRILDALTHEANIKFEDKRYGFISEYRYRNRILFLLKPSTYVNLSGRAVNYWLKKKSVTIENLLVVNDDLSLPLGTVRLRPNGGDGGHNGLKNVIDILGHQNFARLRFGIGNNFPYGNQVNYVLSEWTKDEEAVLDKKIPLCLEIITSFVFSGLDYTMNTYNNK